MKRYRFRLEAVLRARRAQEDMARQELARANRTLQAADDLLRAEQDRYRALAAPSGTVDVAGELGERQRRELVAAAAHEAGLRREDLAVAAAVQQAAWREAAQRVAALERLDARRRADHELALNRSVAAEIDDLVTSRFTPEAGSRRVARPGGAGASVPPRTGGGGLR